MKPISFLMAVSLILSSVTAVRSDELSPTMLSRETSDFSYYLRNRPLEIYELLGKHFSQVAPGTDWQSLPSPEEYKNPAVKYGVFVRPELKDYMHGWKFLDRNYCVSHYSMFLLYFNKGYVFQAELRYIADTFTGSVNTNDSTFCADETPLFDMIAKEIGGSIVEQGGAYKVTLHTGNYVVELVKSERSTDIIWKLRGGPSSPNF